MDLNTIIHRGAGARRATFLHRFSPVLPMLLLAACAGAPVPPPQLEPEAEPDAGPSPDSIVQVLPLSSPEVEVLVAQAREAEAGGSLQRAEALLAAALDIAPTDPKLWQSLAELALKRGQYQAAIGHALQAFELGPQVGAICQRNWRTLELARAGLGQSEAAAQAGRRAELCHVRAGPRF